MPHTLEPPPPPSPTAAGTTNPHPTTRTPPPPPTGKISTLPSSPTFLNKTNKLQNQVTKGGSPCPTASCRAESVQTPQRLVRVRVQTPERPKVGEPRKNGKTKKRTTSGYDECHAMGYTSSGGRWLRGSGAGSHWRVSIEPNKMRKRIGEDRREENVFWGRGKKRWSAGAGGFWEVCGDG